VSSITLIVPSLLSIITIIRHSSFSKLQTETLTHVKEKLHQAYVEEIKTKNELPSDFEIKLVQIPKRNILAIYYILVIGLMCLGVCLAIWLIL
ncbi:hypothetical protein, partial [Xanthovirga aplysinae]|uniref:hypothetical protein n=1 Tax=Xanthovirga aplysinae TaxID=2529853 RepID=UPI001CA3C501